MLRPTLAVTLLAAGCSLGDDDRLRGVPGELATAPSSVVVVQQTPLPETFVAEVSFAIEDDRGVVLRAVRRIDAHARERTHVTFVDVRGVGSPPLLGTPYEVRWDVTPEALVPAPAPGTRDDTTLSLARFPSRRLLLPAIPAGAIAIGDSVPKLASFVRDELLHGAADAKDLAMKLVATRAEGTEAVFAGSTAHADVELVVRIADGRLVALRLVARSEERGVSIARTTTLTVSYR